MVIRNMYKPYPQLQSIRFWKELIAQCQWVFIGYSQRVPCSPRDLLCHGLSRRSTLIQVLSVFTTQFTFTADRNMQPLDLLHALALLWLQNNNVCLQNLRRLFVVKWEKLWNPAVTGYELLNHTVWLLFVKEIFRKYFEVPFVRFGSHLIFKPFPDLNNPSSETLYLITLAKTSLSLRLCKPISFI